MKRLALLAFLPAVAWAHDSYPWMQDRRYVDAQGIHCCDNTHCLPVQQGEMERTPTGWRHIPTNTTLDDGAKGTYASQDAVMYRCVWGGALKCVFWTAGF